MAINTEFTHRRSASAASSVNEAGSDGGSSSGSASTVATARSTPFIGPQNHPGLPPQFHPAPVDPVYGNLNARHDQTNRFEDTAFAFQLDQVETQIRLLDTHGPYSDVTLGSEYDADWSEPLPDGIDINELHAIEADIMFALYYNHYDPADGPFPASNTLEAINAPRNYNHLPWGPRQYGHMPEEESDNESDSESDNESDSEATTAAYETPLMPRYHAIASYNDLIASTVARPGTIAGMAIRDQSQPAHTPPIIGVEARSSAGAMAEMTQGAYASAAPVTGSSSSAVDELDPNLAAVVHNLRTGLTPASTAAVSQEVGADLSSAAHDVPFETPIFPANWVTHTRTSIMSSRQPRATPIRRRNSHTGSVNYTTSPISRRFTYEREGDGA
ncbi:hypothetical protein M436DRAFT_67964 [Aureobasidium namibiae CBS 147.97]|uniref:Uncharacterized protein n=1 Tax=Aureobasidium namibiae CBS 147.97 TaxID=1043004 RepID=A0A074WAR5_9PEZI